MMTWIAPTYYCRGGIQIPVYKEGAQIGTFGKNRVEGITVIDETMTEGERSVQIEYQYETRDGKKGTEQIWLRSTDFDNPSNFRREGEAAPVQPTQEATEEPKPTGEPGGTEEPEPTTEAPVGSIPQYGGQLPSGSATEANVIHTQKDLPLGTYKYFKDQFPAIAGIVPSNNPVGSDRGFVLAVGTLKSVDYNNAVVNLSGKTVSVDPNC